MLVTSVASTQPFRASSREQPRTPVEVWRAPRTSVAGLDPGVFGDRPVPHLLAALLTPTRAPHAHLQACTLPCLDASSLVRFFPRALQLSLSFLFSSPSSLSRPFSSLASAFLSLLSPPLSSHFSLAFFYFSLPPRSLASAFLPQNGPPIHFISVGRLRQRSPPQAHPPHLRTVTMTTRALSKNAGVGASERMLLRKNEGGLQSSRKNVAEEI